MATKQVVVEATKQKDSVLSTSDYSNLEKGFPASPIYSSEITDESITNSYIATLNAFNAHKNPDFPEGINMNYANAPSYEDVADEILDGLLGYPASPFVPNPTGTNDVKTAHNPLFKMSPPDDFRRDGGPHKQFGSITSQGTDLSPKKSAEKISNSDFTNLKMGQSSL